MTPRLRSSVAPLDAAETSRTGMEPDALQRAVLDHLYYTCAKDRASATDHDLYMAMAHAMRDRLLHRWLATRHTYRAQDAKRAYYLSAEFLLGRAMAQNLLNLGLYDTAERMLSDVGVSLADILEEEPDPGLGNGGLGRLAACFLDSLAALELPGFGYGIRYEYGIFEQRIVGGRQVERADSWLREGNPWEVPRHELALAVNFYGRVEHHRDDEGRDQRRWVDTQTVVGVPYDLPIAGYGNDTVNTLRLWSARASNEFNLEVFNAGDFRRAVEEKALSEAISRVLYPADHSPEGRELRLKQQYFFCACAIHDILRRYKEVHSDLRGLPDKAAIQLNDTHPSIAIAELMRLLIDREHLDWDVAWDITERTFAYTNHTLMPEALEKWPVAMFERLLPRHLEIIYEINQRMLRRVHLHDPTDGALRARMSLIEEHPERQVRMAHLAVVGSHSVNGVAALHSELVRTRLLPDFARLWPERFNNKTNGVSPRRWLMVPNPALCALFDERVGPAWSADLHRLRELEGLPDREGLLAELAAIKLGHKRALAEYLERTVGLTFDPEAMLVAQIKRIHEYKRQLLNALHIIALYQRLKADPDGDHPARTFLVAGKAAPGYLRAKHLIHLIHDIASIVNEDPVTRDRLRVVFAPNYSVTLAEHIIPASDVSLQISLAGTEASGTGNMKLAMNGALTVGTLDGANIEIRDAVGAENFFLFGMDTDAVERRRAAGYAPQHFIDRSPALAAAIGLLEGGCFSPEDPERYLDIVGDLRHHDEYMVCADFDDYLRCHDEVTQVYRDTSRWQAMCLANIARMGGFSSDETIRRYANEIWGVSPVHVRLGADPG
ncbi:MAG: glycogen/starch/alpha-glucan phosphorylase [Myxococcales bacterium]|nr:glycogen/starch/alpha-glucan phosphorylase [Myxococcales bacterium]